MINLHKISSNQLEELVLVQALSIDGEVPVAVGESPSPGVGVGCQYSGLVIGVPKPPSVLQAQGRVCACIYSQGNNTLSVDEVRVLRANQDLYGVCKISNIKISYCYKLKNQKDKTKLINLHLPGCNLHYIYIKCRHDHFVLFTSLTTYLHHHIKSNLRNILRTMSFLQHHAIINFCLYDLFWPIFFKVDSFFMLLLNLPRTARNASLKIMPSLLDDTHW